MRPEKQLLLDEIKEKIDHSVAMIVTKYQGLDPNLEAVLRSTAINSGGVFQVIRKRVLMKAAEASGFSLDRKMLEGHIGVAFAKDDAVQFTKAIYQFRKDNENVLEVLGGRFEGQMITSKDVELISKLPSRDEMRAQLLGVLEAPLSQTLGVFDAILTSVIYCLDNKAQSSNT
jgi:large subunit ribosomal protein L10